MDFAPLDLSIMKLPFIDISFLFKLPVLIVILAIFFIFYMVATFVLFYHWRTYGMEHRGVMVAEVLYSIVSIMLFCAAGLSVIYL